MRPAERSAPARDSQAHEPITARAPVGCDGHHGQPDRREAALARSAAAPGVDELPTCREI
jgi:hypothetical protein